MAERKIENDNLDDHKSLCTFSLKDQCNTSQPGKAMNLPLCIARIDALHHDIGYGKNQIYSNIGLSK
jgi:hypothetical protein